jgi:hypothetical protein
MKMHAYFSVVLDNSAKFRVLDVSAKGEPREPAISISVDQGFYSIVFPGVDAAKQFVEVLESAMSQPDGA